MSSRVESREQRTRPRGRTAAAAGNQLLYVSFTFPEAAGENERFLQEHTCRFRLNLDPRCSLLKNNL